MHYNSEIIPGAAGRSRAQNTSLARAATGAMYGPLTIARVVKWQTRAFEGRMPQGMGVRVPPRANSPKDIDLHHAGPVAF